MRPVDRALPGWLAAAVVFGSSAAVLVLEITALRLIAPYVGITLETNTSVIGLALAAIAFGAWSGGAAADRRPPLSMIGPLLVVGGALVLLVTPTIRLTTSLVGPSDAPAVALMLAAVTVFAPAAVLSAVSPMVVKLQLSSLDQTGAVVGRLSGIGTLGAILATFLTGFVLVSLVPTSVILLGTGGVLVVAGAALVIVARRHGEATRPGTAAAIVVALVAGAGGLLVASPCDVETKYHCVSVRPDAARPGGQVLVLDTLRHSYVDAGDPAHLEFGYMRTFAAALDTLPSGASSMLHVGGGGMTLPRYLLQARPEATHTVVEIDPGVVGVDRSRLALPDDPRLRVEVADGRVAVAGYPDDSFDAYVGDAFGGIAVPWHLTTRETFEDVARVLRPGGLVVLNVIDFRRLDFARAEVATLASVFDHVALAAAPDALDGAGGNLVILASDQPIDRVALETAMDRQESPMELVAAHDLIAFVGDAPRVLRDDWAPVDQLLTTGR